MVSSQCPMQPPLLTLETQGQPLYPAPPPPTPYPHMLQSFPERQKQALPKVRPFILLRHTRTRILDLEIRTSPAPQPAASLHHLLPPPVTLQSPGQILSAASKITSFILLYLPISSPLEYLPHNLHSLSGQDTSPLL